MAHVSAQSGQIIHYNLSQLFLTDTFILPCLVFWPFYIVLETRDEPRRTFETYVVPKWGQSSQENSVYLHGCLSLKLKLSLVTQSP